MLGKKITIDYEINNIFYKTIYNTVDNYIDIIKEGEQDFNIRFDPDKIDDVLCMIKKHRKDSKFSYTIPQEDMIYKNFINIHFKNNKDVKNILEILKDLKE